MNHLNKVPFIKQLVKLPSSIDARVKCDELKREVDRERARRDDLLQQIASLQAEEASLKAANDALVSKVVVIINGVLTTCLPYPSCNDYRKSLYRDG